MFSKFTLALWFWWIICPGFNGLLCMYIYIVEKKKNITQIISWEEKRRIDIIFSLEVYSQCVSKLVWINFKTFYHQVFYNTILNSKEISLFWARLNIFFSRISIKTKTWPWSRGRRQTSIVRNTPSSCNLSKYQMAISKDNQDI